MVSEKELQEYRKWMMAEGFSPSTIRHAMTFIPYLEKLGMDMNRPTYEKAMDFIAEQMDRGIGRTTINGWVKQLNRWFRFRGFNIHLKNYKVATIRETEYLPDEKVREMLELDWGRYDLTKRNQALLYLLFASGLRVSEVVSLNWKDIDWDRNLIIVRHGKGNKSRKVPVPHEVMERLRDYKEVRIRSDSKAVFTSAQGRLTDVSIRRIVKEAGRMVRCHISIHPHLARHWRAKNLLAQGVNLNVVQKILGHSNIKTTSIYLDASYEEMVMDMEEKDRFFSPKKRGRKPNTISGTKVPNN